GGGLLAGDVEEDQFGVGSAAAGAGDHIDGEAASGDRDASGTEDDCAALGFVLAQRVLDGGGDILDGVSAGEIDGDAGAAVEGELHSAEGDAEAARAVEVGELGVGREARPEIDGALDARRGGADDVAGAERDRDGRADAEVGDETGSAAG